MAIDSQHIVTQRFAECIRALVSAKKVSSARQCALSLDYKPQGLSEILLGKRNVPIDLIYRAAEVYRINVRYLFYGEGDHFDTGAITQQLHTHVLVTDHLQKERIVHVPVAAHAGYRDNLAEPVFVEQLPTYALPDNILRQGSYRSFEVAGDSMEPTIFPGDKVIGAFVEPQYWEQGIKDGTVHVLITYQEVLIKRVTNYITKEHILELHSDNPGYRPYVIPIEDLREAWVVRLRITGNLSKPEGMSMTEFDDRLNEQTEMLRELKETITQLQSRVHVP